MQSCIRILPNCARSSHSYTTCSQPINLPATLLLFVPRLVRYVLTRILLLRVVVLVVVVVVVEGCLVRMRYPPFLSNFHQPPEYKQIMNALPVLKTPSLISLSGLVYTLVGRFPFLLDETGESIR